MSTTRSSLLVVALMATVAPTFASAQVPSRPGLAVGQPSYATPPTTTLVQRQHQGNPVAPGAGAPGQDIPPTPQPDYFYVEDGSPGPGELASGLSDHNTQRMSQAGEQLRGHYGAPVQNGMPAGMVQDAWNRPFDNMSSGQSAPGTIRYQWSADLVMPVRLRAGMVSSIVLPDWEAAQDVVIGDGAAVEANILRPNQIAIKSVQTGLDTSIQVVGGSGNIYTFYLRTEGRNTKLVTDLQIFVQAAPSKGSDGWFNNEIRGAYAGSRGSSQGGVSHPAMPTSRGLALPASASQGDDPVPVDRRVFDSKMFEVNQGDRMIAPEYVYNDGRFTYLHFPAGMTDRPAVFRIVDGVEGRVNTRVVGRHSEVVIVEALGDFVLRSGTRAVCIKRVDGDDQVVARRS